MSTAAGLIRALGRSHTYDPRRNPALVLGLAWGSLAGLFSLSFAACAARVGAGRAPSSLYALGFLLLLVHPVVLGLLSGALGTVLSDRSRKTSGAERCRRQPGMITDAATGLYTPEYMLDQLRLSLARVARSRDSVTIVIFELDPPADDAGFCLLAQTIRPLVRESDILGRMSEEQLLLVVHGDLPCASCLTDRVADSVYGRTHLRLEAGVARWPEDGRISAELLYAADLVLKASWKAKHAPDCPRQDSNVEAAGRTLP
jgi:GGDEF domain-containing protein